MHLILIAMLNAAQIQVLRGRLKNAIYVSNLKAQYLSRMKHALKTVSLGARQRDDRGRGWVRGGADLDQVSRTDNSVYHLLDRFIQLESKYK